MNNYNPLLKSSAKVLNWGSEDGVFWQNWKITTPKVPKTGKLG